MNILATDGIDKYALDELNKLGHTVTVQFFPAQELKQQLAYFDVLIVRSSTKIGPDVIDSAVDSGKLKLILRGGVGMDNIDVSYAMKKGIKVSNTPTASSNAVAELALAHIISASRHMGQANHATKVGSWEKKLYEGVEISGKTLGIIGFGRIGRRLATIASVFGMNILAYDCYQDESGAALGTYCSLDEIISMSDIISLHLPCPIDGKAVICEESIAKMKDGVIIVNTSRGNLIDEVALLKGLESGKIYGVGLDVYQNEPSENKMLLSHPRVSCTPHIGAATKEAQEKIAVELVKIIKSLA